jgi:hypothetical protein
MQVCVRRDALDIDRRSIDQRFHRWRDLANDLILYRLLSLKFGDARPESQDADDMHAAVGLDEGGRSLRIVLVE